MIYMVEMNLVDPGQRADWDAWYLAHMHTLLGIPGIRATQRFECLHDHASPFVALHEVDGPGVFASSAYTSRAGPAGTGAWRDRMDQWHRNLFDGLAQTPDIPDDGYLVIIEERAPVDLPTGMVPVWLTAKGLDRSVARRAIAVCRDTTVAGALAGSSGVRVMRPLTRRLVAP